VAVRPIFFCFFTLTHLPESADYLHAMLPYIYIAMLDGIETWKYDRNCTTLQVVDGLTKQSSLLVWYHMSAFVGGTSPSTSMTFCYESYPN
jgi:hypothetical protein